MNLLIDIGNTAIKAAIYNENNQMAEVKKIEFNELENQFNEWINLFPISHALISATGKKVPQIENILQNNNVTVLYLSSSLNLPFKLDYKTPDSLGADRMALCAGAVFKAPKKNRLIIDAGTCITYDFIDNKNIFRGGAISPGIDLRFKSMHDYTDKLPLIKNYKEEEIPLTGKDTIECLKSGAIWGTVNEIESFTAKHKAKHKDLTVFLTGGSQIILERYLKNEIFVNSKFLLFEGMNLILNMNK
jgi:type III pantothenate kinase